MTETLLADAISELARRMEDDDHEQIATDGGEDVVEVHSSDVDRVREAIRIRAPIGHEELVDWTGLTWREVAACVHKIAAARLTMQGEYVLADQTEKLDISVSGAVREARQEILEQSLGDRQDPESLQAQRERLLEEADQKLEQVREVLSQ